MNPRFNTRPILFLPPKVRMKDVFPNGKIMTDACIAEIKEKLVDAPDGRYSKQDLKKLGVQSKLPCSIVKDGDTLYAVYLGRRMQKLLGQGAFGSTKLVQNLNTGVWDVIKIIQSDDFSPAGKVQEEAERESSFLAHTGRLRHHHFRESPSKKMEQAEIVMEFAPGISLRRLLPSRKLTALEAITLSSGIFSKVQMLHRNHRVLHRDLHPGNIVTNPLTLESTIVDFGLAAHVPPDAEKFEKIDKAVGADFILAPEIFENLKSVTYSEKTEVYALGFILKASFHLQEASEVKNEIHQLISDMMNKNPEKRISLDDAINRLAQIQARHSMSHLNILSKIKHVGYLDIEEFASASKEKKNEMMIALSACDEVQLFSSSTVDKPHTAMVVKHALEKRGLRVHEQLVIQPAAENTLAFINRHRKSLEDANQGICFAFFVSPKKQPASDNPFVKPLLASATEGSEKVSRFSHYEKEIQSSIDPIAVNDTHFQRVITSLTQQKDRLKKANIDDPRVSILATLIMKLKDGQHKLTYGKLFSALNAVDHELLEAKTEGLDKILEKLFNRIGLFQSQTRKSLGQTFQSIKHDLGEKKRHGR